MEIILGLLIVIGAFQLGDSLSDSSQPVSEEIVFENIDSPIIEEFPEYIKSDGYYIKDLTLKVGLPKGCKRPILTSDLSDPIKNGVRNVTKVETTCEG